MNQREVFLAKALETHKKYELATTAMRQMMRENRAFDPEWDAADACQLAALEEWSSLLRHFHDIHTAE
jgi:hypothetical protein